LASDLTGEFAFAAGGSPLSFDVVHTGGTGPEFDNIAGVIAILVVVAVAFLLLKKKQ